MNQLRLKILVSIALLHIKNLISPQMNAMAKKAANARAGLSVWSASSTERSAEALVRKLRSAAGRAHAFAQAFDPSVVVNARQLLLAHALALKAFAEEENCAKTLENETLAKAAATRKVAEAIAAIGVKSPDDFLLLTDARGKSLDALLEGIGAKKTKAVFRPDRKRVKSVFGATRALLKNYSLEDVVLEAIALSGSGK